MKHTTNKSGTQLSPGFGHAETTWFERGEQLASDPSYIVYEARPGRMRRLMGAGGLRVGTVMASAATLGWLVV